jgi:hypothetical protein
MSNNYYPLGQPSTSPEELPDSRLSHHRTTFCGPVGLMSKVFCANCGKSGGAVTEEWAEHIFFICDACAEKGCGSIPGAVQIPEEVVKGEQADPLWDSVLAASTKE